MATIKPRTPTFKQLLRHWHAILLFWVEFQSWNSKLCVFSAGLLFLFLCYIWIYYTIWKKLKPIATQKLPAHCFSCIIMQVLRNSLITLQSRFLWKPEISCCWGFLPGFVLVSVFPRNISHMKINPRKSSMRGEVCALLETAVPRGCWNCNLQIFWEAVLLLHFHSLSIFLSEMEAAGREGIFCTHLLPAHISKTATTSKDMLVPGESLCPMGQSTDSPVINTGALPPCWTTMEKLSSRGDTVVAYHQHAERWSISQPQRAFANIRTLDVLTDE